MGLGRAAVENLCRAMLQDTIIRDYINAGPPFLGESHFKDKDCVKTLGARWNCENKKWVACNKQVLAKLIRSTKWLPTGFTQNESIDILQIIEKAFAPVAANCEEMLFDRRAKGANCLELSTGLRKSINFALTIVCALRYVFLTRASFCKWVTTQLIIERTWKLLSTARFALTHTHATNAVCCLIRGFSLGLSVTALSDVNGKCV